MVTADQLAAQEIKARFQIGQAQIPINAVTLTHTIDELPYATILVQLDNQGNLDEATKRFGAVNMDLSTFAALSRTTQEKILNNYRVTPDTQLVIQDGEHDPLDPNDGHELRLNGFLGRPEFKLQNGNVFLGFSLVHAKAVMQAFNCRIYGAQQLYSYTVPHHFFDLSAPIADQKVLSADSIAARMQVLINGMTDGYSPQPNLLTPDNYDSLPIHNLNMTVKPAVDAFLKKSLTTTQVPGIREPPFDNANLLALLWTTILGSANFFQSIATICQEFMFQMNADYEGSAWLEWSQVNTDIDEKINDREISVPVESISFTMANIFQLPLLQVLVQSHASDLYGLSGDVGMMQGDAIAPVQLDTGEIIQNAVTNRGDTGIQLTSLARYPSSVPRNAVGLLSLIAAPLWTNPATMTLDVAENLYEMGVDEPAVEYTLSRADKAQQNVLSEEKTRQALLDYMAKQQFKKLYLQGTTAQVTIPLNLRVRPGYTYLVSSITGETLFTGYLVSAIHDVVMGPSGTAASATTSLAFTHVIAPAATINALQTNPTFPTATMTINAKPAFVGDVSAGSSQGLA